MSQLAQPASAADDFTFDYRIERASAAKLSIDTCAEITKRTTQAPGYVQSVNREAGKLVTITGGPAAGGSAFIVHCIASDDKTVYVVQALDYRGRKTEAAAFADKIRDALKAGE
ncbi:hypothetical protein HCU64_04175 [Methylobacterium sp. C25]|uniref:DUF6180 family protein n=1 Tax=Methylobacterium sp. C25 TaxID=2721622 RepID=UPI001F3CA8CD|nr:DUF6180 family protein [Methylobacterium sp. C25]MCE4222939.1 hypothetical protein [Methylobacterium sp. C25]